MVVNDQTEYIRQQIGILSNNIFFQRKMNTQTSEIIPLDGRFNLFCREKCINPPKYWKTSKQDKLEIKLIFHHPNFLYLNPKPAKCSDEIAREVEQHIIDNIKSRKKSKHKTITNNLRATTGQFTSTNYSTFKVETFSRCKSSKDGFKRYQPTQNQLEIFGKASNVNHQDFKTDLHNYRKIKSQNYNPPQSNQSFYLKQTGNLQHQTQNNLFDMMEKTNTDSKMQTWTHLWKKNANKYAVRLNMYLDMEKKYQKLAKGKRITDKMKENHIKL